MHNDGRSTSSSLRADTSYRVITWLLRTCQDLLLNLRDLRRGEPHLRDGRIVRLATRRLPHDNRSCSVMRASHHLPTSCRWICDPAFKNILLLLVEPEYETLILHDFHICFINIKRCLMFTSERNVSKSIFEFRFGLRLMVVARAAVYTIIPTSLLIIHYFLTANVS